MKLPKGLQPNLRVWLQSTACAALIASAPAFAQTASTATADTKKASDEIVTLSPFEVQSDSKGYFASNTMSGTRFNTKVEDLAASLTVVTKEQMEDFAMLDINDVFNYTAGTEGTTTFTDYTMDRNGQLTDNVQLNPNGANRVRGMSSANQSYGNFEVNRLSMDRLIIDGLEVSRGPNANVFGLGFAAGTVNQVPASANLTRNSNRAEARVDSYEGYRTSLDLNRVLVRGVLAVRLNGAFQHDGFVRKPSGVNTVRYDGFVKFQPFKNTTINGAFLHYRMNGNRPNFTPPRDYVSDWVNAGKPTWDPIAQVIHLNGQTIDRNGVVTGSRAIVPITSDANIPAYTPIARSGTMSTRGNLFVDQGGIGYWTAPNTNSITANPQTPAANNQTIRLMQTSIFGMAATPGRLANQPLWTTTATVGDHSFYDWSSVNLSSVNRLMDKIDTSTFTIDQVLLDTPRHTLVAQLGFLREDSERYQRTPLGNSNTSGQTGQYFVDVNEKLLDGTPNPYFMRPYLAATEPVTRWLPAKWDTYRLQVAYKLDLRQEKNWLKWLGLHQLTGYDEYKYRINRAFGYRDVLSSDHPWTQTGLTGFAANQGRAVQSNVAGGIQAGANVTRQYFRYYVGDANNSNIDYAPGDFSYGKYPFVWGGYPITSGAVSGAGVFYRDPATLSQLPTTDTTGGTNNLKQIIKTGGAVVQSHFLGSKIVTTFGLREDKVYSKNGIWRVTATTPVGGPNLLNGGTQHDYDWDNSWEPGDYRYNSGKTKTAGVVVRPFRDFKFVNDVANGSGIMSYLGDALRGLSLTYNQSDNFYPQAPAIDLFLNPLPNVTGRGKDYGFWLSMADNKFVLRFNHYITRQLNARDGDANTVAQRVLRYDIDVSTEAYQLYDRADAWTRLLHPDWNDTQVRNAVADTMKIPIPTYDALAAAFRGNSLAATNDTIATGNEIELNFNPTRYWTVNGSVTEKKSISSNISSTVEQWIAQRMPVWTTLVDPNTDVNLGTGQSQGWVDAANPQHLWWKHAYTGSQTPEQNFATFVDAPYRVIKQQEGKSKPSVRRWEYKLSTSYQLAGITENRILKNLKVGGSFNLQDKGAIGYYGKNYQSLLAAGQPITELDPSNPIWDKSRLYVNAFVSYRTKLYRNKIGATFQLNVENIGENGRLQPIGAFPDGTPNAYRIVDPQKFILTASFDL